MKLQWRGDSSKAHRTGRLGREGDENRNIFKGFFLGPYKPAVLSFLLKDRSLNIKKWKDQIFINKTNLEM